MQYIHGYATVVLDSSGNVAVPGFVVVLLCRFRFQNNLS